jgi:hypothetical protein
MPAHPICTVPRGSEVQAAASRDLGIQIDTHANESPTIPAHGTSWKIALMSNWNRGLEL